MSLQQILVEPRPQPGLWNMAVDSWLLEQALTAGVSSARLYQWDEPTVSLGHFQKADDPAVQTRFANLPRVRRLSGGGAILHDRELTYSLAVAAEHPLARDPTGLYSIVHDRIIAALAEQGVSVRMRGEALTGPEPFLCFGRGDPRDIVMGPHKILGSAQRRRKGAILQHGALLLERSPHAEEFPGLLELTGRQIDLDVLQGRLAHELADLLGNAPQSVSWTEQDETRIRELQADHAV
jgi:lipoate-protein ligase A